MEPEKHPIYAIIAIIFITTYRMNNYYGARVTQQPQTQLRVCINPTPPPLKYANLFQQRIENWTAIFEKQQPIGTAVGEDTQSIDTVCPCCGWSGTHKGLAKTTSDEVCPQCRARARHR